MSDYKNILIKFRLYWANTKSYSRGDESGSCFLVNRENMNFKTYIKKQNNQNTDQTIRIEQEISGEDRDSWIMVVSGELSEQQIDWIKYHLQNIATLFEVNFCGLKLKESQVITYHAKQIQQNIPGSFSPWNIYFGPRVSDDEYKWISEKLGEMAKLFYRTFHEGSL